MDDIGNATTNFEQLVLSLREIFTCIRQSGLKLLPEKCEIATDTMKFWEITTVQKEYHQKSRKYLISLINSKCQKQESK